MIIQDAHNECEPRARIIVVGNSKGGTGKSTMAMHVVVSLLRQGCTVGTIDLDAEQGTLSRYVENRRAFQRRRGVELPLPVHHAVLPARAQDGVRGLDDERARFKTALAQLDARCGFVVIDTPAGESALSVLGHSYADTLVTPLNDSFIDLDVLAYVEPESHRIERPSRYSAMVWEIRKERARRDRGSVDWVILRNRLAHLDAHNKRAMGNVLNALSRRIGFRIAPGLSERVIYRELFLMGLTLLDLRDEEAGVKLSMSHIAARRELADLFAAIGLVNGVEAQVLPANDGNSAAPAA
jgi:chromosome partitioning protein